MKVAENATEKTALKDSPARWGLLTLLVLAMVACYAHRNALSIAVPFLKKEMNLTTAQLGVMLSAFSWCYAFLQMPSGWLVDRYGVRRVYGWGYLLWSLATAFTGFARSFLVLIPLRVATGAFQAIAFPATSRAVADWFQDRERGTVTALYLTGVRVGTALISWFGGLFLAQYDVRLFFLVTGLIPLVWLLPWHLFLRKWETPTTATTKKQSISLLESLTWLRHKSVLGIFLGFFAYDYAWFVYINWLPGYLSLERGFTPQEMGIYSAMPYLAMSVIILSSGTLSDWLVRHGWNEIKVRKGFIMLGLAIGCLVVPAGFVEDKMTAVWLLTIALCGIGIASPNTWTLTQAVCEKRVVGTVSGIQNWGGNVGGIIAPALTGLIAQYSSFATALCVVGGVLVAGILAYWLLIEEKFEAATG
ncbi:MAG TPA: MFS transporter [Blastocatellia bacterium]|nr:MFS transporter [Blastocatellia bacterium]